MLKKISNDFVFNETNVMKNVLNKDELNLWREKNLYFFGYMRNVTQLKMWPTSNSNCDKTQNSKFDKTQELKSWPN